MTNATGPAKQRIAVLGGGVGAMSTVWALTSQDGWQDRYDITVYQMGWRLGGKGASGRGPDGRIQEHGLHIWLGFYENAFRVMREVFAEIRDEPAVFHSVEDAFEPHDLIGAMERFDDAWRPWLVNCPRLKGEPGDGVPHQYRTMWDIVVAALDSIEGWVEDELGLDTGDAVQRAHGESVLARAAAGAGAEVERLVGHARGHLERSALHAAVAVAKAMPADPAEHHAAHHGLLTGLLDGFLAGIKARIAEIASGVDALHRIYMVADLAVATLRGLIDRGAMIDDRGFDVLDDMEWQAFFETYGASRDSWDVARSAPMRAFYDLVFAFEDGDTGRPNFAAGAGLRCVFCILLLYKNSIFMKMRAGMGDTIFAPLYKALRKRGVRFAFFHRLDDVGLGEADGDTVVETLRFGRQATVKAGEYDPFVEVAGLDCWPQAPLVEQLVEGDALLAGPDGKGREPWSGNWKGYDLEDFWTTWKDVDTVTLTRGRDFDLVVLAIPPSSHPFVCPQLIDRVPRWAEMVERVGTVRTQALQLWLKPDLAQLGWSLGSVVVDAYQEPFDTWADMSHLIPREAWPATAAPGSIAYFCSPMRGGIPPRDATGVQEEANAAVEAAGNAWLGTAVGALWPKASVGPALDPAACLVGVCDTGEGLMHGQYRRANVSPSERYVLSLAGATAARIDAAETGCANLFVAGDWTRNGFNTGCVEAGVMSGLRASNAISGRPALDDIATYW